MPKSRVSRVLAALERDLGVALMHRTTRRVALTDEGRRFLDRCHAPLESIEEAARSLASQGEALRGTIRLTAPQDFGNALLPPILDDFLALHPAVRIEVVLAQDYVDLVQGSIDVAIRIGPLADSRLKVRKIAGTRLSLVASPTFLESAGPFSQLADLVRAPALSLTHQHRRGWVLTNGKARQILRVEPIVVANDPELLLRMALRNRGVALLPDFACEPHLRTGRLTRLFRTWRGEGASIQLVHPYRKSPPAAVGRFGEFLATRLRAAIAERASI